MAEPGQREETYAQTSPNRRFPLNKNGYRNDDRCFRQIRKRYRGRNPGADWPKYLDLIGGSESIFDEFAGELDLARPKRTRSWLRRRIFSLQAQLLVIQDSS